MGRDVLAWSLVGLCLACSSPTQSDEDAGSVDAAPDAAPVASDYVFADDMLRTYELRIDPADWEWLNVGSNTLLEQYVRATLTFEGTEYGPIGVRYKGGFGTLQGCFENGVRVCPKLSMTGYPNAWVIVQTSWR